MRALKKITVADELFFRREGPSRRSWHLETLESSNPERVWPELAGGQDG